jgi:hypothetical protein
MNTTWLRITHWQLPTSKDIDLPKNLRLHRKLAPPATPPCSQREPQYRIGKTRENLLPTDIHMLIAEHWDGCPEHLYDYLREVGINPTEHPQKFGHWLRLASWRQSDRYRNMQFVNAETYESFSVTRNAVGKRIGDGCGCRDEAFGGKMSESSNSPKQLYGRS